MRLPKVNDAIKVGGHLLEIQLIHDMVGRYEIFVECHRVVIWVLESDQVRCVLSSPFSRSNQNDERLELGILLFSD